jgi:6-phosphogluconolactonase
VRSFEVAHDDGGRLRQIGCVESGGEGPAYVSSDRSGKVAFVANYAGGTVAVFAISESGALQPPTQVVKAGKHPHSIAADVQNRRVSVPVLGEDVVLQYAFDPARGLLEPAFVPRTNAPAGTGPRHIDFHPTLPLAYVVHEHSSQLTAYGVGSDGAFRDLVTLSTLPGGLAHPGNTGSDVHVAPSGRFLYASNRGHDSTASFALDAEGVPSPLAHSPTMGSTPRNFCLIEASGGAALLLVANLRSDCCASRAPEFVGSVVRLRSRRAAELLRARFGARRAVLRAHLSLWAASYDSAHGMRLQSFACAAASVRRYARGWGSASVEPNA